MAVTFNRTLAKSLAALPAAPGTYLFYNARRELIYVGKATSLKQRVKSYFRGPRLPRPVEALLHEVAAVKWQETNSALEAIIAEALAIKKFQPKYNVLGKDDKSWNYLVITKDEYPRLQTIRQHEYARLAAPGKKFAAIFGPYPGFNAATTLKLLRRLFRFSTCQPRSRPCLYYEMGRCPGVCSGEITPRDYRASVVRPLRLFLSGKTGAVIRYFTEEMRAASREERFEDAARARDQLRSLTRLQDVALINKSFFADPVGARAPVGRLEGYDISNLGASEKVGSLVVFDAHGPLKAGYRRFIIKTVPGQNDVECLSEVLARRLRHPEWPWPDLILVDGGRIQVRAAERVLAAHGRSLPLIGLAKGPKRQRTDIFLGANAKPLILWIHSHRQLLTHVRNEAHRFAVRFHRQRRNRLPRSVGF